jgi:hypothetical protein
MAYGAAEVNHSMHGAINGAAALGIAAIFTAARNAREERHATQASCAQAATSARLEVVRSALQQTIDENHALQAEVDSYEELALRQAREIAELRDNLKQISRAYLAVKKSA